MNGYGVKRLSLAHNAAKPVSMRIEIDVTGDGLWIAYRTVAVPARETVQFAFPGAFQACWIRMVADSDCAATATLVYE